MIINSQKFSQLQLPSSAANDLTRIISQSSVLQRLNSKGKLSFSTEYRGLSLDVFASANFIGKQFIAKDWTAFKTTYSEDNDVADILLDQLIY